MEAWNLGSHVSSASQDGLTAAALPVVVTTSDSAGTEIVDKQNTFCLNL